MRVLITGITGFAGSYLADCLLQLESYQVFGLSLSGATLPHWSGQVTVLRADLRDAAVVRQVLAEVRPAWVYHLAAQPHVPTSLRDPWETFEVNLKSEVNLLEQVRQLTNPPGILIVGSGEEYGVVRPEDLPLDEETPLLPASPYAVSKVAQDLLGYQYYHSYHLQIVRVRPFNHVGPRQSPNFAASSFARQIAMIERGLQEPVLRVGNLAPRRDYTDVRDIVRGYRLILEQGAAGAVYNLGSGRSYSVAEMLELYMEMTTAQIEIRPDPARMRGAEIPEIICDSGKIYDRTGWRPEISLARSLADTLAYWRQEVAQEFSLRLHVVE
ncbi:MAG: GDP-mannose 4,6-dehydratase [Chloroflexi bacterium]|nr:GDP-mannose 4,6-dehydratase [Chloroflexota bacterium]